MKKKILSVTICLGVTLFATSPLLCIADNGTEFYDYVKRYEKAPNSNTYTQVFQDTKRNGNEGIVASKIIDLDNDGQDELMILLLNWDSASELNALDFIVVEKENNKVYEKSRVRLTDDSSCLTGDMYEDIKIVLKDNYLGYVYKETPIQGEGITYKIYTYDGNKINTIVSLYNPGYTDGVALYDVTNCNKLEYYYDGICLFENHDAVGYLNQGLYNSYDEAISDKMKYCSISSYSVDDYSHDTLFNSGDLLCRLTAIGSYDRKTGTISATSQIYCYADISDIITVILNNTRIEFDQPPVMINDRTMVPIRAIFEAMGYTVDWNQSTKTATATKRNDRIVVQIGNSNISYTINGVSGTYYCDVAPQIVSDRTLVPVRAIAECAGCNVDWDGDTKTVYINN